MIKKMILAITVFGLGWGLISDIEAAPREPEYTVAVSFPNGCAGIGVLGEITWAHTSSLKAKEVSITINGTVSSSKTRVLKGSDKNRGEMSLLLEVGTDPNHGVWQVTGRLLDEDGGSLGKEWHLDVGVSCNL